MTEVNDVEDVIDVLCQRFERNVEAYNSDIITINDDDCKYSAYAIGRALRDIDEEIGEEAVSYLRENGL